MSKPLDQSLLDDVYVFEVFLKRMGFKRIEGSVFGLLALSDHGLTSEEIEKTLTLSQASVSQALKTLAHYGAIETRESREKRVKIHTAKEDGLSVVATIFRKREQEAIEEFKSMATHILKRSGPLDDGPRLRRLRSIISTCEIAEAVMNFVIGLSHQSQNPFYDDIVKKLPKAFELIHSQANNLKVASDVKSALTSKFKDQISKITGDFNNG